ncbi:BnaA06g40540D [Brassica napus]|uniref:BnaA06g40540D protein n=1 Tax=Brassica napus TaxID=3708 RepID=A0A078IQ05_BRANA|nr:BnaA06g40540D [Brassica napus]
MRNHGCCLRKVQEAIRFYSSSSSSASRLLEFINIDFPSTLGIRGRREFARLLQLNASDDPSLHHNAVHGQIIVSGFDLDTYLNNILMKSYSKGGDIVYARKVFDKMPDRNLVTWSTMVSACNHHGLYEESLAVFLEYWRSRKNSPNEYILSSFIQACLHVNSGRSMVFQLQSFIFKSGFDRDVYVGTLLIGFYLKEGDIDYARLVFDALPEKSTVTWTTMIKGYAKMGRSYVSLQLFYQLMESNMDASLMNVLIDSYVKCGRVTLARKLFDGMWNADITSWTTVLSGYKQNSLHKEAMELLVFDEMEEKDLVVWNSMFSGYVQQSENEEALNLFSELQLSRERPDEFTFADMVTAAGNLASLQLGQEFHCQIMKRGLERNSYITNALLDMYSKCGSPEDAYKAFSSASSRDVVCWNSVISSYANHGEGQKALQMLERMMNEGIEPNYITFVGVLSACSHGGLVEDGLEQFEVMLRLGIEPETEHYVCMVSLLSRAGRLKEARELIEKMPEKPPAIVWRSLLSGCAKTGNVELAEHAAEMAIACDPTDSGSFTLLSNIYASKGMWGDAKKVRERMKFDGVVKEPGRSWIQIDNDVHVFLSKDISHRMAKQIYESEPEVEKPRKQVQSEEERSSMANPKKKLKDSRSQFHLDP